MFDRLGHITAELSSSLLKSIVLPRRWLAGRKDGERARASKAAVRELRLSNPLPGGTLMLVGGSGIPDAAVVAALHHAGGRNISVLILPAGAGSELAAADAVRSFSRFGVRRVEALEQVTPEAAGDERWPERLAAADVLVLAGGCPADFCAALYGTPLHQALRLASDGGRILVAAGGAAPALAEQWLTPDGSDAHAGLGLLPRVVLDAPFDPASRFACLVQVISRLPGSPYLGSGLEAGTALLIKDGEAQVVGDGGVTIIDARDCAEPEDTLSDPEILPGDASACFGLKVHLLVEGYGLNLKTRRPLGPGRDPARTEAAGN